MTIDELRKKITSLDSVEEKDAQWLNFVLALIAQHEAYWKYSEADDEEEEDEARALLREAHDTVWKLLEAL